MVAIIQIVLFFMFLLMKILLQRLVLHICPTNCLERSMKRRPIMPFAFAKIIELKQQKSEKVNN